MILKKISNWITIKIKIKKNNSFGSLFFFMA